MKLKSILSEDCIISNLKGSLKEEIISELIRPLVEKYGIVYSDAYNILMERERLGSTGIGKGVAIPHGKMAGLDKIIISFGRSVKGIPFDAQDGENAHCVFVLLAPDSTASPHLEILQRIAQIFIGGVLQKTLLKLSAPNEMYNAITEEDDKYV